MADFTQKDVHVVSNIAGADENAAQNVDHGASNQPIWLCK